MMGSSIKGVLSLILVSILWGSSFPAIKLVMYEVSEYTYTWVRGLIAISFLTPYVLHHYLRGLLTPSSVRGGLITGVAYALGLWLQAWGTKYTTASNSAFITGLNVVFVHTYVALSHSNYELRNLTSLTISIIGLYLLTTPTDTPNIGDFIVLVGAVMWACQVLLVSRYSSSNPIIFTYFEILPTTSFMVLDYFLNQLRSIQLSFHTLALLTYLAIVCSILAFTLQVYGQRYVRAEIAALIFLLEPVVAAILAHTLLSEMMTLTQILGATLILIAIALSTVSKLSSLTPSKPSI